MYESKQIGIKKIYLKKRVKFGIGSPNLSGYISELTEKTLVIDSYEELPKESIVICEMKDNNQILKFNAEIISVHKESIGYKIKAEITNHFEMIKIFYLDKLKKQLNKKTKPTEKKPKGLIGFLKRFT